MAISHDNNPDISRQFQLLNEGAGIRPPQNRGPMMAHQQPGQPQQQRSTVMGAQMAGMPIQNSGANLAPPQQQHPFTSPNLAANVAPQRGPSPQIPFHQNQMPPNLTYDQLTLKLKQTQDEISAIDMEIAMLRSSRPQQPEQLPQAHAKLTKKKTLLVALQNLKNQFEGQFRQKWELKDIKY